jgi:hypothetical protein
MLTTFRPSQFRCSAFSVDLLRICAARRDSASYRSSSPCSATSARTISNKKRRRSRLENASDAMPSKPRMQDVVRPTAGGALPCMVGGWALVVFAVVAARCATVQHASAHEDTAATQPLRRFVHRWHSHMQRRGDDDAAAVIDTMGQMWSNRASCLNTSDFVPRYSFDNIKAPAANAWRMSRVHVYM